jgi:tetratricopeptide (TPR) repeat protein
MELSLPPDSYEGCANDVRRLLGAGQLITARARCEAFAKLHPTDSRVWSLAADIALRLKSPVEAAEFLRRAVECAPQDAALLVWYGQCLLRLGRRQDALEVALRAERLSLDSPHLHDALGALLTHLEEPARALRFFQHALEKAPTNVDFRYNLAMAQRMTGDLEAAEKNLDEVIAARPDDGEAYNARSDLRRQTSERNHVRQLETAFHRIRDRRSSLAVSFALAKELEDIGEYSRSFAYVHAACKSFRASLQYDVADDVAVLEKLRTTHTRNVLQTLRAGSDNSECIFIVGLPRSGTTLVERILGSHSEVYAAGELDAFPRTVVEAVARLGNAPVRKLEFVERALEVDCANLGPAYLHATRPRTGHSAKFIDKLPLNYLYAGLIHAALPRARFIAVHRHPMDSCYAMYKTLFASAYPFTYDLDDLGRYYLAWERLMRHWATVIGEAWLPVRYEELVSDQEGVSRRMLAHCGLTWEQQCLEFHRQPSAVTSASAAQVRRPLYSGSVGNWRRYSDQLRPLARFFEENGISIQ